MNLRRKYTEVGKQLCFQQRVSEEKPKLILQQQKEIKEATIQLQQREEEWYLRKLNFAKRIGEDLAENAGGWNTGKHTTFTTTQSVKLQRYTITPYTAENRDCLCFWNQFAAKVDVSSIWEISKLLTGVG